MIFYQKFLMDGSTDKLTWDIVCSNPSFTQNALPLIKNYGPSYTACRETPAAIP